MFLTIDLTVEQCILKSHALVIDDEKICFKMIISDILECL